VLTTFDVDEYVYAAFRAGASGFMLKDGPAEGLPAAVRTVADGQALLAPSVTRRLIESYVQGPAPGAAPPAAVAALTDREAAILRAMAPGASNAEIAAQLYLGESTVKTHVTHVLAKLGVRDRLQAVVHAYENGVVRAGEKHRTLEYPVEGTSGRKRPEWRGFCAAHPVTRANSGPKTLFTTRCEPLTFRQPNPVMTERIHAH